MNGKTFAERVGLLGVGDVAVGSIFTNFEKIEIRGAGPRRGPRRLREYIRNTFS